MDNATLQNLAHGPLTDIIWEAPDEFAGKHRQLLVAAIRAHQAGQYAAGEELWTQVQTHWGAAWSANCQAVSLLQAVGLARFSPSSPSTG